MKKSLLLLFVALLALGSCSKGDDPKPAPPAPSDGTTLSPPVGGPNEPNQVYVDLSTAKMDPVKRDIWDLGFYCGAEFRVTLNGAIKMSAKSLGDINMATVRTADNNIVVGGHSDAVTVANGIVDSPDGVLTGTGGGKGTAIAEISANDDDNKVYLINLGAAVGTVKPDTGSEGSFGDPRGWKKIRILRNGTTGYKIQYADLAATTCKEKIITKDANFNFIFFNLTTDLTVTVEPQKTKWDLCFTALTNYAGPTTVYPMADLVLTNMKGGTKAYQVLTKDNGSYADFTKAKVKEDSFTASTTDQRSIGTNWRATVGDKKGVQTDRFYVVKDIDGNYYKVNFLAMTNEAKERGYPTFEYARLK